MTLVIALLAPVACASGPALSARTLQAYVAEVEPIRLAVNQLLTEADPILSAFHDHRMTGDQASAAMDALERRFAAYTVQIAEVRPLAGPLAQLNAPLVHTFVQEDAYLSALTAALPGGDFGSLPNTQSEQRAAIIAWRTQLQVYADRYRVTLPADLQQAGRGDIAPSPGGS